MTDELHRTKPDGDAAGGPRIIRCLMRTDTDIPTFADDRDTPATEANTRVRYAVIGTRHGWLCDPFGKIQFRDSRYAMKKVMRLMGYSL